MFPTEDIEIDSSLLLAEGAAPDMENGMFFQMAMDYSSTRVYESFSVNKDL